MSFRAGVLSFVEAENLDTQDRRLHVWDFLDNTGLVRETPLRRSFPFVGHGVPTVSVPRPVLRRFVLLKSCSVISDQKQLVDVSLFDLLQDRCLYSCAMTTRDSSLFRRGHPLMDDIFALWVTEDWLRVRFAECLAQTVEPSYDRYGELVINTWLSKDKEAKADSIWEHDDASDINHDRSSLGSGKRAISDAAFGGIGSAVPQLLLIRLARGCAPMGTGC